MTARVIKQSYRFPAKSVLKVKILERIIQDPNAQFAQKKEKFIHECPHFLGSLSTNVSQVYQAFSK